MILYTERMILRPWEDSDAEDLYNYAKEPIVGQMAGWEPHQSVDESREIISTIFSFPEMYAVCLKTDNKPIGSIGLLLGETAVHKLPEAEAEMGAWIGVDFWGEGLIAEASEVLIRHAFEDLNLKCLWGGYFDGNERSRRLQEKCGFIFHHTDKDSLWETTGEICTEHITNLTKSEWLASVACRENCCENTAQYSQKLK